MINRKGAGCWRGGDRKHRQVADDQELRGQIKFYLLQDQSTPQVAPRPSDWSREAPLITGLLLCASSPRAFSTPQGHLPAGPKIRLCWSARSKGCTPHKPTRRSPNRSISMSLALQRGHGPGGASILQRALFFEAGGLPTTPVILPCPNADKASAVRRTKGGPAEVSIRQSVLGRSCWNGGENTRRSVRAKKLGFNTGSNAGQRRLTSRSLIGRIAYSPSIRIEAHIACDHFMLSSRASVENHAYGLVRLASSIGRMVGIWLADHFPASIARKYFFR